MWDVHSDLYKNRESQVTAYEKIARTMSIGGFESVNVKAKICSIRNAYTLDLTKIAKSKKSGAGADDVYKPKAGTFGLYTSSECQNVPLTSVNGFCKIQDLLLKVLLTVFLMHLSCLYLQSIF